jgi:segregation and condensation protein B
MDELLKNKLESILFVSNKPLSVKLLAKFTNSDETKVSEALKELVLSRKNNGVVILEANGQYQMATNGNNAEIVKTFLNSDLREKLTDATLEVLAIISYRQPISKAEIEAIRGVNSQYSIRHLLMRGLVDKIPNPHDARGSLYQVTTEFLQQLGITSMQDLPDFQKLVENIKLPETPGLNVESQAQAI